MKQKHIRLTTSRIIQHSLWLGILFAIGGCFPTIHHTRAWEVQIIDSETGKPVEGVVAAARWPLTMKYPAEWSGNADFMETISDKNGYIRFPSWTSRIYLFDHVDRHAPTVHLYKYKYKNTRFHKEGDKVIYHGNMGPKQQRNTGVVELEPFKGSDKEYFRKERSFFTVYTELYKNTGKDDKCNWKKVPRSIVLTQQIFLLDKEAGIYKFAEQRHPVKSIYERITTHGCGSPEQVLPKHILEMKLK